MKTKKTRKKLSKSAIVLIGGIIAISIPLIIFLWIIVSAALNTGKPINGNRFAGDLDPAISKSDLKQVETAVSSIPSVDEVEVVLKTATLRIYVDVADTASVTDVERIAKQSYDKLNENLNVGTYFQSNEGKKMYDLEIHVYNMEKAEDQKFIYYILNKNSKMSEYKLQLVSEPLNPELVKELTAEEKPAETTENSEEKPAENNNQTQE